MALKVGPLLLLWRQNYAKDLLKIILVYSLKFFALEKKFYQHLPQNPKTPKPQNPIDQNCD